jgi:VanZ family protein
LIKLVNISAYFQSVGSGNDCRPGELAVEVESLHLLKSERRLFRCAVCTSNLQSSVENQVPSAMTSTSPSTWVRLCGVAAVALLVISSLIGALAQPRTILGWQVEHFLGYFAVTFIVCAGWPRPLRVAAVLVVLSGLLEVLQAFTPNRHPNVIAALCGAGGVVVAAVFVELFIRARNRRPLETRKIR